MITISDRAYLADRQPFSGNGNVISMQYVTPVMVDCYRKITRCWIIVLVDGANVYRAVLNVFVVINELVELFEYSFELLEYLLKLYTVMFQKHKCEQVIC